MPDVIMPRLTDSMQEGAIAAWIKADGDEVKRGLHFADILRSLEVGKWLIAEVALGRARLNFGRKSNGWHSELIVVPERILVPKHWTQSGGSKRLFLVECGERRSSPKKSSGWRISKQSV